MSFSLKSFLYGAAIAAFANNASAEEISQHELESCAATALSKNVDFSQLSPTHVDNDVTPSKRITEDGNEHTSLTMSAEQVWSVDGRTSDVWIETSINISENSNGNWDTFIRVHHGGTAGPKLDAVNAGIRLSIEDDSVASRTASISSDSITEHFDQTEHGRWVRDAGWAIEKTFRDCVGLEGSPSPAPADLKVGPAPNFPKHAPQP